MQLAFLLPIYIKHTSRTGHEPTTYPPTLKWASWGWLWRVPGADPGSRIQDFGAIGTYASLSLHPPPPLPQQWGMWKRCKLPLTPHHSRIWDVISLTFHMRRPQTQRRNDCRPKLHTYSDVMCVAPSLYEYLISNSATPVSAPWVAHTYITQFEYRQR